MKDVIKKRIEELNEIKNQALANLNACEGAIAELQKLLKIVENPVDNN